MKRFYLSFCLVAASLLLFTKCKKDSSTTTTASTNYSPLTVGSSWTYNYTQNGGATVPYILTATSNDTTINSKKYIVLTSSDGSGNKYLAKADSNYYRFASYPTIGSFEELYLKDNRDVNSTWINLIPFTYSGFQLIANLTYTVKEKGINSTFGEVTYNDVVHIRLDAVLPSPLGNIGGGDFYYSKNIGLIYSNISLNAGTFGSFTSTTNLTSYTIK